MTEEIELKYQLLNISDFKRVRELFRQYAVEAPVTLVQKNIFFDTITLDLRNNNLILRLRRENNKYYLCVKKKSSKSANSNILIRDEEEVLISNNKADLILNNIISPLDIINIPNISKTNLKIIGDFKTIRTKLFVKIKNHNLVLELDKTTYPDKSKIYELEIEFKSYEEARIVSPIIEQLLEQENIIIGPAIAKSTRLYNIIYN